MSQVIMESPEFCKCRSNADICVGYCWFLDADIGMVCMLENSGSITSTQGQVLINFCKICIHPVKRIPFADIGTVSVLDNCGSRVGWEVGCKI
jgi:hypothetical protein